MRTRHVSILAATVYVTDVIANFRSGRLRRLCFRGALRRRTRLSRHRNIRAGKLVRPIRRSTTDVRHAREQFSIVRNAASLNVSPLPLANPNVRRPTYFPYRCHARTRDNVTAVGSLLRDLGVVGTERKTTINRGRRSFATAVRYCGEIVDIAGQISVNIEISLDARARV